MKMRPRTLYGKWNKKTTQLTIKQATFIASDHSFV